MGGTESCVVVDRNEEVLCPFFTDSWGGVLVLTLAGSEEGEDTEDELDGSARESYGTRLGE